MTFGSKFQLFSMQLKIIVLLQLISTSFQLVEHCSEIGEVMKLGPKFRGKVQKRGVLAPDLWNLPQGKAFDQMNQYLTTQGIEYTEDMKLVKNNQSIAEKIDFPRSARCQVFLDPDHKVAYMKNAKTGGSSLTVMLQHACRLDQLKKDKFAKVYQCMRAPQLVQISSPEEAAEIWKNYFVFTTVRNPYSRAASAYSYLLKRRVKLNTHSKKGCRSPIFEQYCLNPFIIGLQSHKFECSDNHIHDYLHVEKESQCLFGANGEFLVDYVLSMDNFDEDWQGMVKELEQRWGGAKKNKQNKYMQTLKLTRPHHRNAVSNGSDYASDLYKNCGSKCIKNIANYYKEDFELLGYEKCLPLE